MNMLATPVPAHAVALKITARVIGPACPCCAEPLNVSQYRVAAGHLNAGGGQTLKSCTACSQKHGAHVFHPVAEFGSHDPENPANLHSECDGCRMQLRALVAQGFTAKEFPYADRLELIAVYETIWTVRCEPEGTEEPGCP